jgi:hypothetical protein
VSMWMWKGFSCEHVDVERFQLWARGCGQVFAVGMWTWTGFSCGRVDVDRLQQAQNIVVNI